MTPFTLFLQRRPGTHRQKCGNQHGQPNERGQSNDKVPRTVGGPQPLPTMFLATHFSDRGQSKGALSKFHASFTSVRLERHSFHRQPFGLYVVMIAPTRASRNCVLLHNTLCAGAYDGEDCPFSVTLLWFSLKVVRAKGRVCLGYFGRMPASKQCLSK